MGYQAESGPWRGFYLTAAMELRHPRPATVEPRQGAGGQIRALPADALLDSLSVRLNGEKAGDQTIEFNLTFNDTGEAFLVSVENAVMHHGAGKTAPDAPNVSLPRAVLVALVLAETSLDQALAEARVKIEGDPQVFARFLALLDRFDFWFEIIAP
jgi:alkyl sulfatase BDS1-like metallo-beta-lactamase superfamily hydrolase